MKNLLSIVWIFDQKIWGDKVNSNPYFATICMLLVALTGALQGGTYVLRNMLDMNLNMNPVASIGFCTFIFGLNMYESIIASEDSRTAFSRILLMLAMTAGLATIGYVASVVIIFLVIAILAIGLIVKAMSLVVFGGPDNATITDSFGRKIKLKKDLSGSYTGSDGNKYVDNHDGTVTKE